MASKMKATWVFPMVVSVAVLLLLQADLTAAYTEASMIESIFNDCSDTIYDESGAFKSYATTYQTTEEFSCEIEVTTYTYKSERYYIFFDSFELPANNSDCSDHKLEIYDGISTIFPRLGRFCQVNGDVSKPAPIYTTGTSFTVSLYRKSPSVTTNFRMRFVALSDDDDTCFDCNPNGTALCAVSDVKCNFYEECPNGFDESGEDRGGCADVLDFIEDAFKFSITIIIIIVVVVIVIIIIGVIACICCCYYGSRRSTTRTTTTVTNTGMAPAQMYAPPPAGQYQQPMGGYQPPPPQGAYPPVQGAYPSQAPPAYPVQQQPPAYPPQGYTPAGQGVGYSAHGEQVAIPQKA
ncbi:uncharacterized protein [Ptychodera flava]|uniref:uncharacterized protein n=1 Tax=Ptychodera flava TaxID=63121 RepID=UPI00396A1F67